MLLTPAVAEARTAIGIIGNIISLFLFLSPIPTFRKILKQKDVQDFKPDPYLATVINCAMWSFYGLPIVKEDSILVTTINSAGLIIELIYVGIFFAYSPFKKQRKIIIVLIIELVATVGVIVVALGVFMTNRTKRVLFVGILCIILNIIMYSSPLTVLRMVIRTKSVKYMPIYLSIATFCNGLIWVAYSVLEFDIIIIVPNTLGALSGLIQIILYMKYSKTTQWNDNDAQTSSSNIQLPSSAV